VDCGYGGGCVGVVVLLYYLVEVYVVDVVSVDYYDDVWVFVVD